MCGLAGVILKDKSRSTSDLLGGRAGFESALTNARVRGTHATGYAKIDSSGKHEIVKRDLDATNFVYGFGEYLKSISSIDKHTTVLMGHTRYATQGAPEINRNNHPIRAGKTIGTHNGWVSNDDELFEHYNLERFAEVDSEVIFRMADDSDTVDEFVNNRFTKIRGRATIVWTDIERPEYVYLLKGNNPLEVAYNKKLELLVYGSTWNIIKDSFPSEDIERMVTKDNHLYRINTKTFKIRATKVACNFSGLDRFLYRSPQKKTVYQNTVKRFVPVFTNKDRQEKLFKNVKASDGSTIRRIK